MEYKYKGELEAKYKVEASFYYRNIGEEQVLCRRAANIKKIKKFRFILVRKLII